MQGFNKPYNQLNEHLHEGIQKIQSKETKQIDRCYFKAKQINVLKEET